MTHTQINRKHARETLKKIEANLHPSPIINGATILHEHKGKKIVFSAWHGNNPVNTKRADFPRLCALDGNFYANWESNLRWLTTESE